MIVVDYDRDRTKSTASLLQLLATMNCAVGVDYVADNDQHWPGHNELYWPSLSVWMT